MQNKIDPPMRLVSFRPAIKNSLRGFASVRLPCGLVVGDVPVCSSHGKSWAALPAKPVLDADGRQVERDGKKLFNAILRWANPDAADRWSRDVVRLVRDAHPEALDDETLPLWSGS